ncbi:MAG: 16S rRNA (cytidine(1402)-2'-O)-methyltransferase [Arenicellales bacterium]|nr:16S rRNA (cytidine(1402)-2'-O)-methyltransferase [Arenicellales bacterium]
MPNSSRKVGSLFVVATPIGNLADMTYRAVETLRAADIVAAEDTRHSRKLLKEYSISTTMVAYHEHNERKQTKYLIGKLLGGADVALITDAGTPLISDPGYRLVSAAHDQKVPVVPIPGCCAAIAALSVAAIPSDRFVFEGFLPGKSAARLARLRELDQEQRTLIFYESAHRIKDTLIDFAKIFSLDRTITLAREITKQFETITKGTLSQILQRVTDEPNQQKGEFVLIVEGYHPDKKIDADTLRILDILAEFLTPSQAAEATAKITGKSKNLVYQTGLTRKSEKSSD